MSDGVEVLNDLLPEAQPERRAYLAIEAFWERAWIDHNRRADAFVDLLRHPERWRGRKVKLIVKGPWV